VSDGAASQFSRLVQLVAELTRRERAGEEPLSIAGIAARFGVTEGQVTRDLRTLTAVGGDSDHEWLGSLCVLQEGDRISLASRGHYRRPMRLTPDEVAAIQLGLAMEGGGGALEGELAALLGSSGTSAAAPPRVESVCPGPGEGRVVDLALRALRESACLEILYSAGSHGPPERVVEVHQVVSAAGRWYLVAWCRTAGGRRHFRADRVLGARLLAERFTRRDVITPVDSLDELHRPGDAEPDLVRVRFSPAIARWLRERFPDAEPDGHALVVTFEVTDAAWLVRTVLQYGSDAEVIGPPAYREAMLRALS
jgi:predicted DNA-binding transcriptional regulator YafY